MRRGGLALFAFLLLGSITKLMVAPSDTTPGGTDNRTVPVTSKASPPAQDSDLRKAQKSPEWYPTALREKIRDFFGEENGTALDPFEDKGIGAALAKDEAAVLERVCKSIDNWCVPSGFQNGIDFVIATAPDPVHSHLGLFFDRSIDAIQQGAASQNYLFDRSIMPWQYFDEPTAQKTDEERLLQHAREAYPGLMIFRPNSGTNGKPKAKPLFVFVVGETPTGGINKQQFYEAVKIIHQIRAGKDEVDSKLSLDFGVLGPSFSGSLYSLQEILNRYLDLYPDDPASHPRVIPVHAVVMATDAINNFNANAPKAVKTTIFMEDSATALDALSHFASTMGYGDRAIAVLNEDDTAYGSHRVTSSELKSPQSSHPDALTLSFPRGISQFRSAYSKDLQSQSQTTDPNQPQRRNLRLDLEVTGSDDDNVAPYAKAQTALSQEAIMLSIVSELRRQDSRFILVRATDPVDELFLGRYLSSQYPDARLVVPTPDLLFAREEGGALDGVLGLNTYPVSPAGLNPVCQPGSGSVLNVFPAASGAGLYNATSSLLGEFFAPKDSQSDPKKPCALSPDLWLTIVSRNEIHPLTVLKRGEASQSFPAAGPADGPAEKESTQRSGKLPAAWALLFVVCLTLLVKHALWSWEADPLSYWQTAKQLQDSGKSTIGKTWILWLGAVSLVSMMDVFVSSVTTFSFHPGAHGLGTLLMELAAGISLVGFSIATAGDFWIRRQEKTFAVSFCVLAFSLTAAGVAYTNRMSNSEGMVLWRQRTLEIASHVSPAMPLLLLLAAFYAWFWFNLKSEALTDWRRPYLPNSQDLPLSFGGLTERVADQIREVVHTFGGPASILWWTFLIVGVFVGRGILGGPKLIPIHSLEGWTFDAAYSILFALALVLLVSTLVRILEIWWQLQPLLIYLDRPGMKQALKALKGFEWSVIWNPLESMQVEARRLYWKEIYVVERLRHSLGDQNDPKNSDLLQALKTRLNLIHCYWEKVTRITWEDIPDRKATTEDLIEPLEMVQKKLAQTAGVLCTHFLNPCWKALPADDGSEDSPVQPQAAPAPFAPAAQTKQSGSGNPCELSAASFLLAEELVACVYATFITIVLLRIRWLIFSAVLIYSAVVFSSASYPFQPGSALRTLALLLFVLGGFVIGYVYEAMHHDATLRRMTSTDPNKIDTAFWTKLASAGLLPLLGLMTSLFPQVGHFLYTIAAPILQATK